MYRLVYSLTYISSERHNILSSLSSAQNKWVPPCKAGRKGRGKELDERARLRLSFCKMWTKSITVLCWGPTKFCWKSGFEGSSVAGFTVLLPLCLVLVACGRCMFVPPWWSGTVMSPSCYTYVSWLVSDRFCSSVVPPPEEIPSDPDTFPLESYFASDKLEILAVYLLFQSSPKDRIC